MSLESATSEHFWPDSQVYSLSAHRERRAAESQGVAARAVQAWQASHHAFAATSIHAPGPRPWHPPSLQYDEPSERQSFDLPCTRDKWAHCRAGASVEWQGQLACSLAAKPRGGAQTRALHFDIPRQTPTRLAQVPNDGRIPAALDPAVAGEARRARGALLGVALRW